MMMFRQRRPTADKQRRFRPAHYSGLCDVPFILTKGLIRLSNTQTPSIFVLACNRNTLIRALRLALVVGTLLLLINQGDLLWRGEMPNLLKMVLTYCVPFGVSVWTSVAKDREVQRHPS